MLAKSNRDRPTRIARDVAIFLVRLASLFPPFNIKTKAEARLPSMATNAMRTRYFMDGIIA